MLMLIVAVDINVDVGHVGLDIDDYVGFVVDGDVELDGHVDAWCCS